MMSATETAGKLPETCPKCGMPGKPYVWSPNRSRPYLKYLEYIHKDRTCYVGRYKTQDSPEGSERVSVDAGLKASGTDRKLGVFLSFLRRKRYGLLRRKPVSGERFQLVHRSKVYLSRDEVEELVGGDSGKYDYIFAEVDGEDRMRRILWSKRAVRRKVRKEKPPWERLKEDLQELAKPLQGTSDVMRAVREMLEEVRIRRGGPDRGPPSSQDDAIEKVTKANRQAFEWFLTSMTESFEAMRQTMDRMAGCVSAPSALWDVSAAPPLFPISLRAIVEEEMRAGAGTEATKEADRVSRPPSPSDG